MLTVWANLLPFLLTGLERRAGLRASLTLGVAARLTRRPAGYSHPVTTEGSGYQHLVSQQLRAQRLGQVWGPALPLALPSHSASQNLKQHVQGSRWTPRRPVETRVQPRRSPRMPVQVGVTHGRP